MDRNMRNVWPFRFCPRCQKRQPVTCFSCPDCKTNRPLRMRRLSRKGRMEAQAQWRRF